MGTPDFAVPTLEALIKNNHEVLAVITQPDRPKGRGKILEASPVKKTALKHNIEVIQPQKAKDPQVISELKKYQPDCIVVVAFGQILPKEILELPTYGCINVHASLLPKYRGAAPIHWAVINGEKTTGITTMQMDVGLDTGDMLLKAEFPITENMTTGELHDQLSEAGAQLLIETLAMLEDGNIQRTPQNHEESTYAPMLKREHEKINWHDSAPGVHNKIRGLNPWPGAYTTFNQQIIKLRGSLVAHGKKGKTKPGEILEIVKKHGVLVATGDGAVFLTHFQPQGKQVMDSDSFINGYRLKPGDILE